MTTKVRIVSRAFVKLGRAPINDLETGGDIVAAASDAYDEAVRDVLAWYSWTFATATLRLTRLTATPPSVTGFRYAYQLPADMLQINRPFPISNYDLREDKLYSNVSDLTIEYTFKPDESRFPYYFTSLLTAKLAADICILVTEDKSQQQALQQETDKLYRIASYLNARSHRPRPAVSNPFLVSRW